MDVTILVTMHMFSFSQLLGISQDKWCRCWKLFQLCPKLVSAVGRDGPIDVIETSVCKLYKVPDAPSIDHARYLLFSKYQKAHEALPTKKDALELHIARANLHAKIWFQADRVHMNNVSLEVRINRLATNRVIIIHHVDKTTASSKYMFAISNM